MQQAVAAGGKQVGVGQGLALVHSGAVEIEYLLVNWVVEGEFVCDEFFHNDVCHTHGYSGRLALFVYPVLQHLLVAVVEEQADELFLLSLGKIELRVVGADTGVCPYKLRVVCRIRIIFNSQFSILNSPFPVFNFLRFPAFSFLGLFPCLLGV